MAKNKLKKDIDKRIDVRISKLMSGKAKKALQQDPLIPEKGKNADRLQINESLLLIEKVIPKITEVLKKAKKHIPNIWDRNGETAAYLLVGKALSNLETVILLAKNGKSMEVFDLVRSGIESLDLAFLFLQDGQEKRLSKWFSGKIIENSKARKQLHNFLNNDISMKNKSSLKRPIKDLTSDIYSVYSLYAHSSYGALLDRVDVFSEDFDYEGYAGYHYSNQNVHLIYNLALNVVLKLKHLFGVLGDNENFTLCSSLQSELFFEKPSKEEIDMVLSLYSESSD